MKNLLIRFYKITLFVLVLFSVKGLSAQHVFVKASAGIVPINSSFGTTVSAALEGKLSKRFSAQFTYSHYYLSHYDRISKQRLIPEMRVYVYDKGKFRGYVNPFYVYTIEGVNPEEGYYYKKYYHSLGVGYGNQWRFGQRLFLEAGIGPQMTQSYSNEYGDAWEFGIRFTLFLGFGFF